MRQLCIAPARGGLIVVTMNVTAALSALPVLPVFFALSALATSEVLAQQPFPSKPVRMLIPSPPGGGTDTLGRLLQQGMVEALGQPVIADNRGGANGQIAAVAVAKAAPDGYTLLFTYSGVLTTGQPLFGKLPYDPMRDFAPVAMMAHVPGVLVAHPSFPAKTVGEIIKMARAKQIGRAHV